MRFGSVCSGIEAASVAWHPLGCQAAWFSEIEPFPCAVLAHHYPEVPNYGDMTTLPARILAGEVEAPDLFCGGTPCQAFSVAGLRRSLDDERGNLSLTFVEIADAIDDVRRARGDAECIVFWENVPGVLSTQDNAFGCFLGALAGCDTAIEPLAATGWTDAGVVAGPVRTVAWRVLDAQYFGLAQRRRRVFVVASAREGFDPAAVLLEFEGVRRDSAPSRCLTRRIRPTSRASTAHAATSTSSGKSTPRPSTPRIAPAHHSQARASALSMSKPATEATTMIDLKAYDNRLAYHDWHHAWSDDHGVWARGEDNYREIKYLAGESPAHGRLFEAYSKHAFTGKPWNTPHFTQEQLDAVRRELGVTQEVS